LISRGGAGRISFYRRGERRDREKSRAAALEDWERERGESDVGVRVEGVSVELGS
jgi:hypothetical protein